MSRPLRAGTALLIASAIGGASCSSRDEALGSRALEIVGGTTDHAHPAVVAVQRADGTSTCSGTLVSPTRVLTAAHCIYGVAAADLVVLVGEDITSPSEKVEVARASAYPTYRGESEGVPGGVDLGVVDLARPLSIAPILVDVATTDADFEGEHVTVVGYGASDGADNSGVGFRRTASLEVSKVCSRLLTIGGAGANVCFGDSGGAVLLGDRLVAVVSGGKPGCFAPSALTRLDAHARWMAQVLGGDPSAPCTTCVAPSSACDASVETPPPSPDAATDTPLAPDTRYSAVGGGCRSAATGPGDARWTALLLVLGATLVTRRCCARARISVACSS